MLLLWPKENTCKEKERMRIETSTEFYKNLEEKYLLLDTSVFIDCLMEGNGNKFKTFIQDIKKRRISLMIPHEVKIEYLKGSKSAIEFEQRKKLVDEVIDYIIPIPEDLPAYTEKICLEMGQRGAKANYVDILLGSLLIKYPQLRLLTKNITDFPSNVYTMEGFVTMIYESSILNYGLYKYHK